MTGWIETKKTETTMTDFRDKADFHDVTTKRETPDALLCVIEGKEYWIPKSQIDDDSEVVTHGDRGTLIVSQWIAEQKGLV